MGKENLEDKSNDEFDNSGKIILNYEDFANAKKGNFLALSMSGNYNNQLSKIFSNCTTTFFKKREVIDANFQKVFLHHSERTSDNLYNGKKPRVVEYILPRTGKLKLNKFKEGEVKNPNKNNPKRKL